MQKDLPGRRSCQRPMTAEQKQLKTILAKICIVALQHIPRTYDETRVNSNCRFSHALLETIASAR